MRRGGLLIVLFILSLVIAIGTTSGFITLPCTSLVIKAANITPQVQDPSLPYIAAGKVSLGQHDIINARLQFKQAVAANPSNSEANLLYAVTRVAAVLQRTDLSTVDNLSSVQQILQLAGASVSNLNIYGSTMTLPKKLSGNTPGN